MNPFPALGPLCPWESPEQVGQYAAVDHAQHAFEDFQREFPDASPLLRRGRMVLVSGGSGCGKTSLIHRCAHWLSDRPPADHQVKIIDLTEDHEKGADSQTRVRDACERLLEDLGLEGIFEEAEMATLQALRGKPQRAYSTLSKLLCRKKWILVVPLPPSTVADELILHAGLVRRNMLLLTETPFDDVATTSERQLAPDAPLRLRVGPLGIDDGWGYLRHYAGPDGTTTPVITEETMREVVKARTEGNGLMTVTELQRLMHGIFEHAAEQGKTDLSFDDFLAYAFRTASLI